MKRAETDDGRQTAQIDVVGAVIVEDGLVFCTQRGRGSLAGRWEFPGGKLEVGESPGDALVREILEELGCVIDVGAQVVTTSHLYDFGLVVLTTFYCTLKDGRPELSEHTDGRWLAPEELDTLDWAPADVPAVQKVKQELSS